jgi:tetratricopeptide (TPR) repeat protein
MTTAPSTPPAGRAGTRDADDVRLARVHLRLGQLTLARAELEDLLHRELLDTSSLAVLAEARWRTGDAAAAAEAAEAHLEAGGSDDVAICIAAEAAAAEGRPGDARELMDRLPAADAATLDAIFAGMPRRAFWPAGPVDRSELDDLRRDADGRPASPQRRVPGPIRQALADAETGTYRPPTAPAEGGTADTRAIPGPREVLRAASAWSPGVDRPGAATGPSGSRLVGRPARAGERRIKGQLDPAAELAKARTELETKPDRAFLRLALVLRHDPTLAPMVLDALHLRREPGAALLRGDAQRLLGRHLEAEAAFDAAAESLEVP